MTLNCLHSESPIVYSRLTRTPPNYWTGVTGWINFSYSQAYTSSDISKIVSDTLWIEELIGSYIAAYDCPLLAGSLLQHCIDQLQELNLVLIAYKQRPSKAPNSLLVIAEISNCLHTQLQVSFQVAMQCIFSISAFSATQHSYSHSSMTLQQCSAVVVVVTSTPPIAILKSHATMASSERCDSIQCNQTHPQNDNSFLLMGLLSFIYLAWCFGK